MMKRMMHLWKPISLIVATALLISTPSIAMAESSKKDTRTFLSQQANPKKAEKPPAAGSYLETTIQNIAGTTGDVLINPTGTLTGKGVDSTVEYLGHQLELAHGNTIFVSTVPKNEKAARAIAVLNNKRRNLEQVLATARSGSRHYNSTARAIERNINKVGSNMMVTASGARRATYIKVLGRGTQYLGTLFNGINIYSDINAIDKSTYTHKHPSMIFISDALLSANIAVSSFAMTPFGKNPVVIAGAFITGLTKDIITSDTFGNLMNSQNNFILRGADSAITSMNNFMTSPTMTAIPEDLILRWYRYMGTMPSDEALANAEAIHQRWLKFQQTPEYQARIKRMQMGLGRKPGDGVGAYKPNIYLYPTQTTKVDVTFQMPALLEKVIPDYPGSWVVHATPNGTLRAADGKDYEFLFYESLTWPFLYQTSEGWLLKAETRSEQLELVMKQYGFNDQETADFVAYWTEKLDAGTDYAMYPQLTETVNTAMPMTITPTPDTLFRLWFAFEKGSIPNTTPQVAPLERNGFTAVEWGGVILADIK